MKDYRFLIIPSLESIYDYRMVKGLSDGITQLGYFSVAISFPCSDIHLEELCKTLNINAVIGINRTFEFRPINSPVRYISWFQDVFTSNYNLSDKLLEDDLLYTLGSVQSLGIKFDSSKVKYSELYTGVDSHIFNSFHKVSEKNKIDFSFAGFIPAPFSASWEMKKDLIWYFENCFSNIPLLPKIKIFWFLKQIIFRKFYGVDYVPTSALLLMKNTVESLYQPLTGSLDIHKLGSAMESLLIEYRRPKYRVKKIKKKKPSELKSVLSPYYGRFLNRTDLSASMIKYLLKNNESENLAEFDAFNKAIAYFSNSYPRLLDRVMLVDSIMDITRSLQLYGKGWDTHPKYSPYYCGSIDGHEELLNIYSASKINLANNTHGLGMHSRNLECMAVGGFLMMHTSPNENVTGGMAHHFLPGMHYGSYTHENLKEEASYWLKNETKRIQIGLNARDEIMKNHLWIHRAKKIIKDLDE